MTARILLLAGSLLASAAVAPAPALAADGDLERARAILRKAPLIDGHNDLPWQMRSRAHRHIDGVDLAGGTHTLDPPMHTDIPRLRQGVVGAQFWSVWLPTSLSGQEAIVTLLEQMDVVHRLAAHHPDVFEMAYTAADIRRIARTGRIASLIGIEGGHSIGGSLAALRMAYEAGARYMTLTHWRTTAWADAATDAPQHGGLSPFGEAVVREMNRLGMLVDLSHVSADCMRDALRVSAAPVIFSHSGAFAINPHPRNVPDAVLEATRRNGGVVMVDFLPAYVSKEVWEHQSQASAEKKRLEVLHLGDPDAAKAAYDRWLARHPAPRSTVAQVADHIEHIRDVAGEDALGLGGDYDGMSDAPDGLEDVSDYPNLFVELLDRGWSEPALMKLAGGNLLRAFAHAEAVAAELRSKTKPSAADLQPREAP